MAQDVTNYVLSLLQDKSRVDQDLLLTTRFLLETWKKNMISGPDEELKILLEKEDVNPDAMEDIRQSLIAFASTTDARELFQATITVLNIFEDKRHIPLYQAWLYSHTKRLLMHNAIMNSLLLGLNDTRENVIKSDSWSITEIEKNIDYARTYLKEELGLIAPY